MMLTTTTMMMISFFCTADEKRMGRFPGEVELGKKMRIKKLVNAVGQRCAKHGGNYFAQTPSTFCI